MLRVKNASLDHPKVATVAKNVPTKYCSATELRIRSRSVTTKQEHVAPRRGDTTMCARVAQPTITTQQLPQRLFSFGP